MLTHALRQHKSKHLLRNRFVIEQRENINVVVSGQTAVNFCSNDYLNLTQHPDVIKAFIHGTNEYGLGSGASSLICGYHKPQQQLEETFSDFLNRERSLLFNSGYHANLGVISALGKNTSAIIADKLCHASIIDGIILSRNKHFRYPHNDIHHANTLLQKHPDSLVITESIFSMQGNIASVKPLAESAGQNNAMLIVDDAHGIGVLGEKGKGICEHFQLSQNDVPCLVIPLGKSFGSMGAVVSGSDSLIEYLLQFSRTYCYTTALPPAISFATLETVKIIQQETWRREKLRYLSDVFTTAANERKLPLISMDQTPIKSILVGSNEMTLIFQEKLLEKGFFVSCIRPPTVPSNTARIRISLSCMHTENQIIELLDFLTKLYTLHHSELIQP